MSPTDERRTLDRYLSRCGVATREDAKRAIVAGRVKVGGQVIRDADHWITPGRDRVTLDGRPVRERTSTQVVLFNKPRGVVSTFSDPEGRPTLRDTLPSPWRDDPGLRPVGRLDRASAGLLLFTDSTDLADRLLSPEFHVEKEYRVKVRPAPSDATLAAWRRGVDIGDATPTAPAGITLERTSEKSAVIGFVLREGRNRQIRRMAEAAGSKVEWLVRRRFGPIALGDLPPGEARLATADELSALLAAPGR